MGLCLVALLFFWRTPVQSDTLSALFLCTAGFFVYGPQALAGIAVANLATKRAAASAVGLTGLFAYLSTAVSGVGVEMLVNRYGWDAGFSLFVLSAFAGTCLFTLCWRAKAHGCEQAR